MARIGLVLGAGGVVGASYVAGALEGLRRASGFEAKHADVVVGTSAGAFIGALVSTGLPVWAMHAKCTGELAAEHRIDAELAQTLEQLDSHNRGSWLKRFVPARRLPRPVLASPGLFLRGLRAPTRQRLELTLCALLGEGLFSTSSISAIVQGAAPDGWPARPLWIVACDLDTGERVVFGQNGKEPVPLAHAVSASTAIPTLFAPMSIQGRRLVDGGIHSPSNLDLLADQALDAVICIHPLGGATALRQRGPLSVSRFIRQRVDDRLADERGLVEAQGTPVYVLHPTAEELAHMPRNPMDLAARAAVMRRAACTVAATMSTAPEALPFVRLMRRAAAPEAALSRFPSDAA